MRVLLLVSALVFVATSSERCASTGSHPWCDTSLSFQRRVALLVEQITDAEAVVLLGNGAKNISRLSIPDYQWWSEVCGDEEWRSMTRPEDIVVEGLHGVAHSPGVSFREPTPVASSFPQVITTASSFDVGLFRDIGEAIGVEGRAFNNAGNAGLTYWTPNINVAVDPRWGRLQETPGEDPFLNGVYGSTFVRAFQNDSSPDAYIRASACVKHFDTYHLETNRFSFDGNVTEEDLHDTYMRPMAAAIPYASCIMCAYVAVNGVPSCANSLFMQRYARDDFKFQGYLTGDCGAVQFVETQHHYTSTHDATVAVTLGSGLDIDCGSFLQDYTQAALEHGAVSRQTVNRALSNLFWTQMKLGLFDPPSHYTQIPPSAVNSVLHQKLALTAALRGLVLMKNDGALPWTPISGLKIAVVGPNANATTVMQGNYFGQAPYLVSPLAGLQKFSQTLVSYEPACGITSQSTAGFSAALKIVAEADRVVAVMGLDQSVEREGHDRTSLGFPGVQLQFLQELLRKIPDTPVTLVLIAGGAIDVSPVISAHPKLSVIYAGYPGQSGGDAIAKTIYGESNPSGRLTQTWYRESFVQRVSLQNMNMRRTSAGYPGRTYRYLLPDSEYLVYPFGHGLSYTRFGYADGGSTASTVRVSVTNTGGVPGADVVLAFNVAPGKGVTKELFFFERVTLEPNQTTVVEFPRPPTGKVSIGSDSVGNELHLEPL